MGKKKSNNTRLYVQIFFFALIAAISINHTLAEQGRSIIPYLSSASLHALCPFGGVVTIYEYFVSGQFIKKIHEFSWLL